MSSILSELSGASVGAVETAIGFALGFAASDALGPLATTIRQEVYSADPSKALDPADAARIVAQALASLGWGENESAASGLNAGKFDLLQQSNLTAPGVGELLETLRRKTITTADFTHGLRKAMLEPQWDAALADLQHAHVPPADLAYMVVRGLVPDAGLLPVAPPATGDKVARFPVANINTLEEAATHGWDAERFRALVGRSGLSMAPGMAANAYFRGEIGLNDFYLAVAEGDLRNEWRDAILDVSREILTAGQYAELQLRGYSTRTERLANTAKHGMTPADSDLLYNVLGRSIPVHQITTGQARGGTYNGATDSIPKEYLSSLERGNLRPEYYSLAYANRYTYPSAFVLRAIVQAGELTQAEGHQALLDIGWEPSLAAKVAAAWSGTGGATTDTHEAKAETQVWTALHRSYVNGLSTDAEVEADLTALAVAAPSIPKVLALWQRERAIVRRSLTPAQLKKAAAEKLITAQEATARLLALGYTAEDAGTLLAE